MFDIILGCMFSGKSNELKRRADRVRIASRARYASCANVLFIRPSIDVGRYGKEILTHNGVKDEDCLVIDDLAELEKLKDWHMIQYIFIDEIQFYKNVLFYVLRFLEQGKKVTVAGLDAYDTQEMWPEMMKIIPFATHLLKLTAVCMKCGADNASLTISKKNSSAEKKSRVKVGGLADYEAICVSCYSRKDS
jgi:thymidine kinase